MNITSSIPAAGMISLDGLSPLKGELGQLDGAAQAGSAKLAAGKSKDPSEVARQFEAVLVRQILSESMKGLLEEGEGAQVYGYFIEETLADGITKGAGIGLRSVLEGQLRKRTDVSDRGDTSVVEGDKAGGAGKAPKQSAVSKAYGSSSK